MSKKNIRIIAIATAITLAAGIGFIYKGRIAEIFDYSRAAVSYYGSTGQEVKNIQTRLKNWGYYQGAVDGNYGYQTFTAVKSFQAKNGLTADGVCGSKTLAALGLATGGTTAQNKPASSASGSGDTNLLAHIIHGEARGEPYTGQVAVGAVIINRTRDSRFPKTIAGVIYQPGAFDAVSDGQINMEPDSQARKAASDALNGWDPTSGCIYYWNPATATSKWIWSRPIIIQIGEHVFAK